jgi:uncharacterized protein
MKVHLPPILGVLNLVSLLSFINPPCVHAQYIGQNQSEVLVPAKIRVKAYSFDLQNVKLLDSRFKENMGKNGSWLLGMDINRLLYCWHVNANIPTTSKPYGGWEAPDCEVRGHAMGDILSALAMMYASTGNMAFKNKGDSLVAALTECQKALNQDGYLSAFPQSFIDRCIAGQKVWAPWYTIDKIMAGLTCMYIYTGNKQALDAAIKMSSWAYHKLHELTPAQLDINKQNEFGGMIEASYNLYAITGNQQNKELAEMFYDHKVFDPLAQGKDQLAKLHANTQIPKIIGEARGYELTGNGQQKAIASFFWQTVIAHHTFATGGNSDEEHFFTPDKLSEHLGPNTTETCNTYNMLKLTRHLFSWTADPKYADYYEQALYNHILASQDPVTSMVTYYMPLKPGLFKVYSTSTNSFWCCVATGFESHAKYAEGIYYHDNKGVYVNLFIPSELNWKEKGLKITQQTKYPEEATIHLSFQTNNDVIMSLYIRYPIWATSGAEVKVNGSIVKITQKPGSYIVVNRKWETGDKVDITYPMTLHLIPTNDDPDKVAIAYGPIVLAGKMGTEGIISPAPYAPVDPHDFNNFKIPSDVISTLYTHGKSVSKWLNPVEGQSLVFKTSDVAEREITMIPYYQLHGERYVLYWDLK